MLDVHTTTDFGNIELEKSFIGLILNSLLCHWFIVVLALSSVKHTSAMRRARNRFIRYVSRRILDQSQRLLKSENGGDMHDIGKRFLWVSTYAIAMAFLEAVVVVYIRGLLQITNDHVALGPYVTMETWREAATLVMLVSVGWLAGRKRLDRWAYGLFAFGIWDIGYYVWLKVLLDWPASLLSLDTLFLIPLTWWGPVLAPVLIAALMCVVAVLAVMRMERGEPTRITPARVGLVALGGLLALYVFMADSLAALLQGRSDWATLRPGPFQWPLFLVALAMMTLPSLMTAWPCKRADAFNSKLSHPRAQMEEP